MRYFICKVTVILLNIVLMLAIYGNYGNCHAEGLKDCRSLQKILVTENLLAMSYWYLDDTDFLCMVVSSLGKNEDSSFPRKLKIFKEVNNTLVEIFEFGTYDGFDTMCLFNEHLLTLWGTGSAFRIRVFSLVDGEFTLTLEKGTRITPEIVDIDNDGRDELFIANGHFLFSPEENKVIQYPDTTDIYKWNGETYQLLKTVPWKNRFKTR